MRSKNNILFIFPDDMREHIKDAENWMGGWRGLQREITELRITQITALEMKRNYYNNQNSGAVKKNTPFVLF